MKTEYTKEPFPKGERPGLWRYAEPIGMWVVLLLLVGIVVGLIWFLIWWVRS